MCIIEVARILGNNIHVHNHHVVQANRNVAPKQLVKINSSGSAYGRKKKDEAALSTILQKKEISRSKSLNYTVYLLNTCLVTNI